MADEITFTPTERDYAEANRDWYQAAIRTRRVWSRAAFLILFCAALGAGTTYIDDDMDRMGTTALGFGLLGLALLLLIHAATYLALPRRTRTLYRQHKALQQPSTYAWSEAGLSVDTANGHTFYPWQDLHRFLSGRRSFLLFLNDQLFFFLPRRLLDEASAVRLESLAAAAGVPRF